MTKLEILWCSGRLKILTHKIKILICNDFDTKNRNKVLVFYSYCVYCCSQKIRLILYVWINSNACFILLCFSLWKLLLLFQHPNTHIKSSKQGIKNFSTAKNYFVAQEGGPQVYRGRFERASHKESGYKM